jgi:hypothetical protein
MTAVRSPSTPLALLSSLDRDCMAPAASSESVISVQVRTLEDILADAGGLVPTFSVHEKERS